MKYGERKRAVKVLHDTKLNGTRAESLTRTITESTFDMLGKVKTSAVGRVVPSVLLLLAAFVSFGCQAPRPLIEADDLATRIEGEYVAAVQVRLAQWRSELAHSWEKELGHVLEREMQSMATNGSIPLADVLSLLTHQGEARERNIKRLDLERQADEAATAGWRESRKIRESIRRWMVAGMNESDREQVFKTAMEVSDR